MSGNPTASEPSPVSHVTWIILTQGDRPDDVAAAVASIPRSGAENTEVVLVANGAVDVVAPDGACVVELDRNVGIPEGRNRGAARAHGGLLVFLDDDAVVADPTLMERTVRRFQDEPDLAVVSFRIADPDTGRTARRHVPRLGRRDASQSGPATSFLGGACAIRRAAFEQVGGLPGAFFYALEETDLAWRLIDSGWRVYYDSEALLHHPSTEIARHGFSTRLTARNRVLLVRRLLPWPLRPLYVGNWFVITMLRGRSLKTLRDHVAGTREGLAASVMSRTITWRTVWRLTRLGRPPII
ncbi:MAG: glycosyltransferase family 2 protein [Acidimicrobiales bacterium]